MTVGGSAGAAHLAGQTIRGLKVIQRLPGTWRWECKCTVCGFSQVQKHDVLMTGFPKCFNSNCGGRQVTADDDFRRERAQERQQAEQRAKAGQAEVDRKARIEAANKARADSVAAKKAQETQAVERAKAVQKARWESEFAQREREDVFAKYNLTDSEIRHVMNHESVTLEDFNDPEQNHFHFLAMQVVNQRGQR